MEDRFLFRGKRNGEWIEGSVIVLPNGTATITKYLCDMQYQVLKVDYSTLGQCTGLKDKNGKLIFEGDRVKYKTNREYTAVVRWDADSACFFAYNEEFRSVTTWCNLRYMEIIGNIHDTVPTD